VILTWTFVEVNFRVNLLALPVEEIYGYSIASQVPSWCWNAAARSKISASVGYRNPILRSWNPYTSHNTELHRLVICYKRTSNPVCILGFRLERDYRVVLLFSSSTPPLELIAGTDGRSEHCVTEISPSLPL